MSVSHRVTPSPRHTVTSLTTPSGERRDVTGSGSTPGGGLVTGLCLCLAFQEEPDNIPTTGPVFPCSPLRQVSSLSLFLLSFFAINKC